ncbi:MAG: sulfatase-like hydrolase/transferase [Bryobacteraceae bacterium]|nr:sulfatase-like hydrolase/transferase [Bryobacteraceae bacterium]
MNWTRRSFLASAAAAPLLASAAHGAPHGDRAAGPNVVLIVVEDVAAWMLACYGNLEIKTPNIDRLAVSGVRFINNFACTPASSASLATLLTGRIPRQHGIADYLTSTPQKNPERGQSAAPASFATEVLLSDVLSSAGYHCGFAGRWNLGNDAHPGHGFAETFTLPAGDPVALNPTLLVNGQPAQESGLAPEVLTRQASAFIDRQNGPFLLVVSYPAAPASGEGLSAKYLDLYKNSAFQTFGIQPAAASALDGKAALADTVASIRKVAAGLSLLDEQVGALQKKIIQKGIFENTVVVFTSVTGQFLGRRGLWGSGYASNPPNLFEESVRTPLIVSWPGRIPTGTSRPELVGAADLVPTLCEATLVSAPSSRNLSGRGVLNVALGKPLSKHETWKDLIFGEFRGAQMARDNRFKLILREDDQSVDEIYDLRKDPGERINQFENQEYADVRTRLTAELRAWHEKYAS